MTPDEKKQYLERIREQGGNSLSGLEWQTYCKGNEAGEAADRARSELQRTMGTARQLEQLIQQCEGRVQACFELLLSAEEERRARPLATDMAEQMAADQMAHALGDNPVESNA